MKTQSEQVDCMARWVLYHSRPASITSYTNELNTNRPKQTDKTQIKSHKTHVNHCLILATTNSGCSYIVLWQIKSNQINAINLLALLATGALGAKHNTLNRDKNVNSLLKIKENEDLNSSRVCGLYGMILLRRREWGTEKMRLSLDKNCDRGTTTNYYYYYYYFFTLVKNYYY